MTFEEVSALALALPGVEDGTSYGTPALKVRGKLVARLKEDGDTLVVRVSFDEREMLMEVAPEAFYLTDHYRPWPSVLVRLSAVEPATLQRLLVQHWRAVAPKSLVKAYDRSLSP
jgi:hypothetical protein